MVARPHRATFAEIVREVAAVPPPVPDPGPVAELDGSGSLLDPGGTAFAQVEAEISPEVARRHGLDGAALAWDACDCGGCCSLIWRGAEQVAAVAASREPEVARTKRRRGHLSLWRSADGGAVILAEGWVSWGDLLD